MSAQVCERVHSMASGLEDAARLAFEQEGTQRRDGPLAAGRQLQGRHVHIQKRSELRDQPGDVHRVTAVRAAILDPFAFTFLCHLALVSGQPNSI
ncbi:MAG: hypothetical protein ACLQB4_07660 [Beijerinckiaceae bacterium]